MNDDPYADLRQLVAQVGSEMRRLEKQEGINFGLVGRDSDIESKDFPEDIRYELMRLAASATDFSFWLRKREQPGFEGDPPIYQALEIESGVDTWGVTPREALERYFKDDVLDRRGDHR